MIISYEHRFVYIKSRKTAGTSVQIALAAVAGDDAVVTPIRDRRDAHHTDAGYTPRNYATVLGAAAELPHTPARAVIDRIGHQTWDEYLTFSIERNPWDKAVSLYYYNTSRRPARPPFAEWLRMVPTDRLTNFHLYSVRNVVAVKRLLKYEALEDELAALCADLGIPRLHLPVAKGAYRPSDTHDWRQMYDERSASYVAELCAREIELCGYTFDDAQTRRSAVAALDVAADARTPAPEGEQHRLFTQTLPDFLYAGEAEEDWLRDLERSDAFAWTRSYDFASLGARLLRSGFFGAARGRESWIFDHMPKTGGSEFTAIADRQLYAHDHLYVRWPASWFGILLGRLERASLVHGHGARYAEQLAPGRQWKRAVCIRDPMELAISTYQQYARGMAARGASAVSVEHWVEARMISAASGFDLNRQVRWLGLDRVPSVSLPQGMEPPTADMETITKWAIRRLDRCDVVGTPRTVGKVFERVSRSAALRVRSEHESDHVANASVVPSQRILEKLPADLIAGLEQLTSCDRKLYQHAQAHPGRVF